MNLKDAIRDQLGVREVPGTDEWPCKCFSPDHDDSRPSASVNVSKGLWVCYSCGRGGSVESLLEGYISDPSTDDLLATVERSLIDALKGHSGRDESHLSESWLRLFSQSGVHQYWTERGFSSDTVEFFDLGYDYESNCVTYPLRDIDGSVLGVVRRRLDGGVPKYLYPKGVNVHDLLYRYHEAGYGETIVLVEGALDAVALHEAGVFALGIYGSRLSEAQEHLLIRLNPRLVITAFDNDHAGVAAALHVHNDTDLGLVTQLQNVSWGPYTGVKDVADLTIEQRQKIIMEAVDIAS